MRSEKEKMLAGELYHARDAQLQADAAKAKAWMARYNASMATLADERRQLLRELLATVGDGAVVRPPFFCDYGYNIRLGEGVFLNFNCVILDVVQVTIGSGTQIGPAVQIYAADHPREAAARRTGVEFGRPVTIGENVWIGGGAILLPGVTIGDDAVIGAGAVVTRSVPNGKTVVGNPARLPEDRRSARERGRTYERWFETLSTDELPTHTWKKVAARHLRQYAGSHQPLQSRARADYSAAARQKSSPAVCADTHSHLPLRLAQSSVYRPIRSTPALDLYLMRAWMMAKSLPIIRTITSSSRSSVMRAPLPINAMNCARSRSEASGLVQRKSLASISSKRIVLASRTDITYSWLSCVRISTSLGMVLFPKLLPRELTPRKRWPPIPVGYGLDAPMSVRPSAPERSSTRS
jgi:maltose O-acetyltransferase